MLPAPRWQYCPVRSPGGFKASGAFRLGPFHIRIRRHRARLRNSFVVLLRVSFLAPFASGTSGRWTSVLGGLGPGLSLRLVGPFFFFAMPGSSVAARVRRATLLVNRFDGAPQMATRYSYGNYLRTSAQKGKRGDGKSNDDQIGEIRAGREADEVDAGRHPPAEAGRRSFWRVQPEGDADDGLTKGAIGGTIPERGSK